MAQHIICRSLSSGRGGGGGAAKAARGRHFIRDGGGAAAPPKAMLDPGLGIWTRSAQTQSASGLYPRGGFCKAGQTF